MNKCVCVCGGVDFGGGSTTVGVLIFGMPHRQGVVGAAVA